MRQYPDKFKTFYPNHVLFFVMILAALASCKKTKYEEGSMNEPPVNKKWVVTTFAGDGLKGFNDGPSLSASFSFPADVALAADGNIYITDVLNHRIRKIANDQVSTVAGSSAAGIVNGNGTDARFLNPYFIAGDATGNLFITDDNDSRIRKISTSLDVFTYAGTGTAGFADGPAAMAQFGTGNYFVADVNNNLYVSDALNHRIRKINVTGEVSTIAGSGVPGYKEGNALTAEFALPAGIAIDKQGNLFVADRGNHRIRKITPAGQVSTFSGSGTDGLQDGDAATAQFTIDMRDMVIDNEGNLYISELDRIRKISTQGTVTTIAGSTAGFADGEDVSAKFDYPNGLAIDAQGNIYVADLNNNRIRKIALQ